MTTMLRQSHEVVLSAEGATALRPLVVPVDASEASRHAVEFAMQVSGSEPSEIVLVALLPQRRAVDELDADEIQALFMASDLGLSMPFLEPADDEARIHERYQHVFLPLQKLAAAARVPVAFRLLSGANLAAQLRDLIGGERPSAALVLPNPVKLYKPLRALALDLLAEAPCTVYVADTDQAKPSQPSLLRRMLANMRQRPTASA